MNEAESKSRRSIVRVEVVERGREAVVVAVIVVIYC